MDKITCNQLWREWMLGYSEDPQVLHGRAKMSGYSEEDWKTMAEEATEVTESLGNLVRDGVSVKDKIAEDAFDSLIVHCDKWFFETNKKFVFNVALLSSSDEKYTKFFDQFYPGLSKYLSKLLLTYLNKLPD